MTKGKRGGGSEHFALWEELKYLKVEATGKPVAIYKRLDAQPDLTLEERNTTPTSIRGTETEITQSPLSRRQKSGHRKKCSMRFNSSKGDPRQNDR